MHTREHMSLASWHRCAEPFLGFSGCHGQVCSNDLWLELEIPRLDTGLTAPPSASVSNWSPPCTPKIIKFSFNCNPNRDGATAISLGPQVLFEVQKQASWNTSDHHGNHFPNRHVLLNSPQLTFQGESSCLPAATVNGPIFQMPPNSRPNSTHASKPILGRRDPPLVRLRSWRDGTMRWRRRESRPRRRLSTPELRRAESRG